MTLILTIENEHSLPNGAPVSVRLTGRRGLDIGRSANIDWTLPDSTRFISGKHCEVRYRNDGYWLNDLSTNGTFLNESQRRIQAPHKLRHGDRLTIGAYIIAVAIEDDEAQAAAAPEARPSIAAAPGVGGFAALTPVEAPDPGNLDADSANCAKNPPTQDSNDADGAGPAARPYTVIRPRGPSAAAAGEKAGRPSAEAPQRPPQSRDLQAHVLEAKAWSAPERSEQTPVSPRGEAKSAQSSSPEPQGDATSQGTPPSLDEFLRHFALGAGVPEHIFARQDGLKVAEELGGLMRMAVEDLTQLLSARFKAKRFARASSQTMIQALDNNPLKFAPTADDALKIMFGPRTSGYLDARRAFEGAFADLKTHQLNTFAAMQQAVRMLVEDLDPKAIDEAAGPDTGIAALFGARKARLWDLYLARWQAKTLRHEDGLIDAFMLYFAQCYDQAKEPNSK